jgi:hypothetical protein
MERRKAITTAATASLTLLAGAAGIALNSSLVGTSAAGTVGQVSPVGTASPPVTVYVDEPAAATPLTTAPTTTLLARPTPVPATDDTPTETTVAGSYHDDDRFEREDGDDAVDEPDDRHEPDEPQELEGGEDDD